MKILRRPRYFGKYAYGVGLSVSVGFWAEWNTVKDTITRVLDGYDCSIHTNSRTYQFNVFSNDPAVLRQLAKYDIWFNFNHVRIVDRNCWNLTLPKPKPKGKFYDEYGWRFEFRDPRWGLESNNVAELEKLSGPIKLVTTPRTFLYVQKLSDVLMFKLIAAEQLLSLDDRHDL